MKPFDVTIPMKTSNTQNGPRRHWAVEAGKRKRERQRVLALVPRLEVDPALVVTLTRYSSGEMDPDDGLRSALKTVKDAIAYRLGVDDRTGLVRWEYGQERAKAGEQAVRVQVRTYQDWLALRMQEDAQRHDEALRAIGAVASRADNRVRHGPDWMYQRGVKP